MLIDGLTIAEGAVVSNLTIASGTADPSNPSLGELFYRSDLQQTRVYNGTSWVSVAGVIDAGNLTGTTLASNVVTSSLTSVGTINSGTWHGTKISEAYGGTNQNAYTTGDILYSSASNTHSKLGIGSTNAVLTVTGGIPAWSTGLLSISSGKTLTVSNSITFAGTDNTTMTFPGASASVGHLNVPQNSQSTAYTCVLADAGKHILHPSSDANARTFTIPANASVAYPIGTTISFVNMTTQVLTIAITTDTMYLAGTGTTGSRSLARYGSATAMKIDTTTWLISGVGLT